MIPLCEDLLFEVLLCLPTTTLLQAKLVCREWRALIASPLFVSNQHARAISQRPGILLTSYWRTDKNYWRTDKHEYIEPVNDTASSFAISALPPIPERLKVKYAFCCGLVCYYDNVDWRSIVVANPITCEYMHLPKLPYYQAKTLHFVRIGFDRMAGTYKVVSVICDWRSLLIITLGDQHWRRVDFPAVELRCHFKTYHPKYECHPSERLVWTEENRQTALLFDVVSETFRCWSEVGPSELWDTTGASLGPQYLSLRPYPMDGELHQCKICRGRLNRPRLCYTNVLHFNMLCRREWKCNGLWDWSVGSSDGLLGEEEDTINRAFFHHASLVSPKEIAKLRVRELGIHGQ